MRGTSEPGEEESGCGPCPYFLDKVDVEDVGFRGKVVGVAEWVGEVRYEGVGGVEECVECDGVDCAEEEDDGDGGESSVSDVGHDDDDGWRRA